MVGLKYRSQNVTDVLVLLLFRVWKVGVYVTLTRCPDKSRSKLEAVKNILSNPNYYGCYTNKTSSLEHSTI